MGEPVKGRTEAGRRREERARHRRQRVADTALRLFLERGYVATTVEAIAREAAVAPATVYQAFRTKQAILARVLDQAIAGDAEPAALLDRNWVYRPPGTPIRGSGSPWSSSTRRRWPRAPPRSRR